MSIFNISTITFCTPGKVLIISVINKRTVLLSVHLFFVYVSATTALHKMSKNQAVEEKYVFIGLVLLTAMGKILDTEKSVSTIHPIIDC